VLCLLELWSHCATRSIDGYLGDPESVERFANWRGRAGELVEVLTQVGFIDHIEGEYRVHDWAEHQPFCVAAKERIERSRKAGRASANARRELFGTAQPPGGRHEGRAAKIEQADRSDRTGASEKIKPPTQPNPTQPNPAGGTTCALQGDTDTPPQHRTKRGAA